MNLFKKEKELILKLTNAVLIIWLIAAVAFVANASIELLVKEEIYTYDEYKLLYCDDNYIDYEVKSSCEDMYTYYNRETKNDDYYNKKSLYISLANAVIVFTALVLLNMEKKTEKKK